MKAAALRSTFLEYFARHGHTEVPSSSLVPANDPSLLFTNAGMVQFKEVFLGHDVRSYQRAASSQRCVRAGGKHNDLENVGYTARHHTFFEMLGNFSFGDYFKHEAIAFAWQFLTQDLALPPERLWVTVFKDDEESERIWFDEIGIDQTRFSRCGEKDNFWSMGETGPCGPCTEIFFDHGADISGGPPGSADEDGDRYTEIWNLVFMQYDRDVAGTLSPLPKPSVDTGMGLERVAAVLQGVHSNYDIDLFTQLIHSIHEIAGRNDLDRTSSQVIADHIRSCAFLIADGITPSNEGRGYVLRRIIRRAARHGMKLGFDEPFFHRLVSPLSAIMGEAYPELSSDGERIAHVLKTEEERFGETLTQGMKILEEELSSISGKTIPGDLAFKLFDTYGFPVDLTADFARERGLRVEVDGFDVAMREQKELSKKASAFTALQIDSVIPTAALQGLVAEVEFSGYTSLTDDAMVKAIYVDGNEVSALGPGQLAAVVLDRTPFYGESGGQVGDRGLIKSAESEFAVTDTQKPGGVVVHIGELERGELKPGMRVSAEVDADRRHPTRHNHTATHLLHAALRNVLGTHVQQKGSLVDPERLRFDFSHHAPTSDAELQAIEDQVNSVIESNLPVDARVMSYQEAIDQGAMALFGEKYGDEVRVLQVGEYSTELCGGTHVDRSGDIGLFKIVSETGVASGVRRVEAVTGARARAVVREREQRLADIALKLKAQPDAVVGKIGQLVEQLKEREREVNKLKLKLASGGDGQANEVTEVAGVKLVARELDVGDASTLRAAVDSAKDKLGSGIVVLGLRDGEKARLAVGVTKDLCDQFNAGKLVNHIAQLVGGKGGGRPDMAQAGGTEPDKLGEAIAAAREWVEAAAKS